MIDSVISSINPLASAPPTVDAPKKSKEDICIEVGSSNRVVDGIRNMLSLPNKLLLWNSKFNSGNVSQETIEAMREYLDANDLHDVHVSVNQYKPQLVWRRTFTNPKTSLLSKLTLGTLVCLIETFYIPKLSGSLGDHYLVTSNTVHLFSDDPAIALHECGHAKDYHSKKNPTLYSLLGVLPYHIGDVATLYKEGTATKHAIKYLHDKKADEKVKHAFKVLVPAFAGYCASPLLPDVKSFAKEKVQQWAWICNPMLDNFSEKNCEITVLSDLEAIAKNLCISIVGFTTIVLIGHLIGRWCANHYSRKDHSVSETTPTTPDELCSE